MNSRAVRRSQHTLAAACIAVIALLAIGQSAEGQLRAATPAAAAQPLGTGVGAGEEDIRVVTASNTMGWALDAPSQAQLASPILLMHGAIQGGWVWNYSQPLQGAPQGVKGLLARAGFRVFNPTLPCHGGKGIRDVGCTLLGKVITPQVYVDSYLEVMRANGLTSVTLVAHSLAGVWAQLLVQQAPETIDRIVFLDAVILESGESFALNKIGWPAQCLSTLWLGAGTFRRGSISRDSWRNLFVQTRADNATFLADTFARLLPEPRGPCLQHLNMDKFFATPKLKVYIIEDQDISISAWGTGSQWSTFAGRLKQADNGPNGELLRLLHADLADHQGMLTQPVNVARAIAAATAIGRPADATSGAVAEFTGEALGPSDASAAQVASAVGKGQALDAVRSIKLQSVALAATAAVEGGQGEQAHAPSSVKP